jgi:hypothetical protein
MLVQAPMANACIAGVFLISGEQTRPGRDSSVFPPKRSSAKGSNGVVVASVWTRPHPSGGESPFGETLRQLPDGTRMLSRRPRHSLGRDRFYPAIYGVAAAAPLA